MLAQDIVLLLQTTATHLLHQHAAVNCSNLPCGCDCPGQKLRCENCPYLEACLSRSKPFRARS